MQYDTAFEMASSNIRFGQGTTREVGMDLKELGVQKVMVLTDAHLSLMPTVQTVLEALAEQKIESALLDRKSVV